MYISLSHCKYQVKPQVSSQFEATCAATMVHRNYFFLSVSNVEFRQASNHCKGVLEAANFANAYKTKKSISS